MRRVKALPLARRNLDAYMKELNESEPKAWPTFLFRAWAIVAEELKKPDIAGQTVMDAVAAAHVCAVAVSARTLANARTQAREDTAVAIKRIFNCAKRRATIRRTLDEVVRRTYFDGHADAETMADLFNGCAVAVKGLRDKANTRTIINALGIPKYKITKRKGKPSTKPSLGLIDNYDAMHPDERGRIERDLQELLSNHLENLTSLKVFGRLAESLTIAATIDNREQSGDLLRAYISDAAKIWRQSDLRPSRARHPEDPEYRSLFHLFLELVLINQFDPRSRLLDRIDDRELEFARKIYVSLPKDLRAETSMGPRNEWLIGDEDLKIVLAAESKNASISP
jgi:hypothetical protein